MLLHLREMLLIQNGFAVTSVCGNAEARRLLAQEAPFDAFWSAGPQPMISEKRLSIG